MITVKVKRKSTIEGLVETDEEGNKHIDYCSINMEGNSFGKSFTIEGFEEDIDVLIKLSGGVYISPKACSSFEYNGTIYSIKEITTLSNKYVKISNQYVIHLPSMSIKLISSLPICSSCGGMATTIVDGKKVCNDCLTTKFTKLNQYNWKPTPNFIGTQRKQDKDLPYHFGIEIEYGLKGKLDMGKLVFKNEEAVYLKADGSINGGDFQAELVSHPHSFNALMDKCWIDDITTLKAVENKDSNGCHIHISRTAFVDDMHYAKWYFLMHEMVDVNTFIGNRDLTRYCSFKPTGKIGRKHKDFKGGDRSLMINETNEHTIECRFFSSTTKPDEIRANIQYLESLIKFTRYSSDNVSISEWLLYVQRKSTKYKQLLDKINTYTGSLTGGVLYRLPVKHTNDITTMSLKDLQHIVSIETNQGNLYDTITTVYYYSASNNLEINFTNNRGSRDSVEINIKDIKNLIWED